jgi:hypothetical protein
VAEKTDGAADSILLRKRLSTDPPNQYVILRIVPNPLCARLAETKRRIGFFAIFPEG